jgi:hypothetical protein
MYNIIRILFIYIPKVALRGDYENEYILTSAVIE